MHTHTPAEWTGFLLLGAAGSAVWSGLFLLVVDAEVTDFDPRPAVRRAIAVVGPPVRRAVAVTHQEAVHAGHAVNRSIGACVLAARHARRDAAWTAAALLMLLTAPSGGIR
ncbi:hypothetical protein AB0D49_08525 [Streptomyces sp. NPDC048290]|uniref:hypothetical protein n=1 Tax=Streptomyces sp. NPDC048290 TaxID=3155811 RepID=UPI00341232DD